MARKKTPSVEKGKENKELVASSPVLELVPGKDNTEQVPRNMRFYAMWLAGKHINYAEREVGYAPGTGYVMVKKFRSSKRVRDRVEQYLGTMPDNYRLIARARLQTVADIEGKALNLLENNPRLALEKPTLLKQIKQSGGALAEDVARIPVVSIDNLTMIQAHISSKMEPRMIEAQVVDVDEQE